MPFFNPETLRNVAATTIANVISQEITFDEISQAYCVRLPESIVGEPVKGLVEKFP